MNLKEAEDELKETSGSGYNVRRKSLAINAALKTSYAEMVKEIERLKTNSFGQGYAYIRKDDVLAILKKFEGEK